ncbi:hypothetical protein G7085_06595 [Tessaracoccus sp. HDW20]|uniref:hypothetical protein n=1 Tax=Tessaracoccus coleopterorum TaxID=2714950 RepID=UPI0018D28842|nr:hypothetical protein [Tessaracoccus coleopterorum]NHB84385.1 hypothetical protein [Tessaracoccus coleopterorum]
MCADPDTAHDVFEAMVSAADPPTAVFAANNQVMLGIIETLLRLAEEGDGSRWPASTTSRCRASSRSPSCWSTTIRGQWGARPPTASSSDSTIQTRSILP